MKKALVFLSPVTPSPTGAGRRIRAYQWLRHLAARHSLTLVTSDPEPPAAEVLAQVDHYIVLTPGKAPRALLLRLFALLPAHWQNILWPGRPPYPAIAALRLAPRARALVAATEQVFVFRLYMMPALRRLFPHGALPRFQLDLDDWESACHERIAAVAESEARLAEARRYHASATSFRRAERYWLPRAERVFVCSPQDGRAVLARHGSARMEIFPNRYCGSLMANPQRSARADAELLFVGAMGYLPNQDAVEWFRREILPAIKRGFAGKVRLHVVGAGLPAGMRATMAEDSALVVHGYVADLTDLYRQADVVVCPLRSGGGTRLKILEAIAHHRAVVSTPTGLEGLSFDSGQVAVAESPEAFAAAVLSLLADPAERSRRCLAAIAGLRERYWLAPAAEESIAPVPLN